MHKILNIDSFKSKRALYTTTEGVQTSDYKWQPICFRTDGVMLDTTFATGLEPHIYNMDQLKKKGYYHLKDPGTKSIDPIQTKRGLYYVREDRCDLKDTTDKIRIAAIDPGFIKPIQCGMITLPSPNKDSANDNNSKSEQKLSDSELQLIANANRYHITEDEWAEKSGRKAADKAEQERRQKHPDYGAAIKHLQEGKFRKKTCYLHTFKTYAKNVLLSHSVFKKELVCKERSLSTWKRKRLLQGHIADVCNDIIDGRSWRLRKNPLPSSSTKTLQQHKEDLKKRWEDRKKYPPPPIVVFFGDGSFGSTTRGHIPIPKKRILAELSCRALTCLIQEYNTSKMCPCGQDELNTTQGDRQRAHKSDVRSAECTFLQKTTDRDELAVMNQLQAAVCAMRGKPHPAHLCKSKRQKR